MAIELSLQRIPGKRRRSRYAVVALVAGASLPVLVLAQDAAICAPTVSTVTLETPITDENSFFFETGGYTVEFRPDSVIDYWREERNADPALAEILANELPLQADTQLKLFINDRLLPLMAADLIQMGRAAIRNREGRLLQSVELARRSGRPCNGTRAFSDPGNGAIILRKTDYAR